LAAAERAHLDESRLERHSHAPGRGEPRLEPLNMIRRLPLITLAALLAVHAAWAQENQPTKEKSVTSSQDPALAALDAFIAAQSIDRSAANWKERLPKPPKASFDSGKTYTWLLETSQGPISIRLMPDVAPMHVSSTIYLTQLGFYDGVPFHRVIPGFMAQGGDPTGTGRGGPGYQYAGEFSDEVKHDRPGLLSMANAGPGTDGSQFFLTFAATPWLDGKHTIFGEVVDGKETLEKLEQRGTRSGQPKEKLEIKQATLRVE
jgi:cyclophilin family peptidyl-prolyl cis-trans isomerase